LAKVLAIENDSKEVKSSIGNFEYDYLVIATGCKTNYFGNEAIRKHTYRLKTTYQAINIRNSILENFEKLLYVDEVEKEALFNIVIVGGGATGHSRQFKKKAGLKTRFYRYKDKIHFDNFRTIVK
jgi:NADH dehydrogenase